MSIARTHAVLGIMLGLLLQAKPLPSQEVERYEVFELSLTSARSFTNKFTGVDLFLTIDTPAASRTVRGFYDGDGAGGQTGNRWKCRYMPIEAGVHHYRTSSTNPDLDGITGQFTCVDGSAANIFLEHGPIRIHPQFPHAVAHHDGTPFFWNGDTEWFFLTHVTSKISQSQRMAAIDFLQSKKVNNLLMVMANSDDGFYTFPWVGSTAPTHTSFDLARLRQWEETILYMQDRGIVADLWFYSDDSTSILPAALSANEDLYFRYMLARFGAFSNVTWNLALEYTEYRNAAWVVNRAALVKAERPGAFLGVHQLPDDTYDFPGNPHLDHTSLQRFTTHDILNSVVRSNRTLTAGSGRPIPIFHEEFAIEGANNPDPNVLRKDAWAITCAGGFYKAASMGFWIGTKPYTAAAHFNHMKILYETVTKCEWWRMEPRNDLVASGGNGRFCLARTGSGAGEVLAYSVSGASFTLNLSALSGSLSVEYIHPLTGETRRGTLTGGATVSLANPFGSGEVAVRISGGQADVTPPSIPASLAATSVTPTASVIGWSPASDPESGIATYKVYRNPAGGAGYGVVAEVAGTSYEDVSVAQGAQYRYRVSAVNGAGLEGGLSAELTVNIPQGNSPPAGIDSASSTQEDRPVAFTLGATDPDGDRIDRFRISRAPARGEITGFDALRGTGVYQPDLNATGEDSFTFQAADSTSSVFGPEATVSVTIVGVNDPPVAAVDAVSTMENISVGVQLVFTDVDGPGPFTYSIVQGPRSGVLSGNSNDRTYTPNAGFTGVDSFTWTVHDGLEKSNVGSWTITVTSVPVPPPSAPSSLTIKEASTSQVMLSWVDNSGTETEFRIERAAGTGTVTLAEYNGSDAPPSIEAAGTQDSFQAGARVVNDRTEVWRNVPGELSGRARLLTARDDRMMGPAGRMYVVELSSPCTLHLPLDPRYGGSKPSWMGEEWTVTGMTCDSSVRNGWPIWRRTIGAPGPVELGVDDQTRDGVCFVFDAGLAWVEVARVGANVTEYTNTGLSEGRTYRYRVRAANAAGSSAYSNEATATTGVSRDTTPPAPPGNMRLVE